MSTITEHQWISVGTIHKECITTTFYQLDSSIDVCEAMLVCEDLIFVQLKRNVVFGCLKASLI